MEEEWKPPAGWSLGSYKNRSLTAGALCENRRAAKRPLLPWGRLVGLGLVNDQLLGLLLVVGIIGDPATAGQSLRQVFGL